MLKTTLLLICADYNDLLFQLKGKNKLTLSEGDQWLLEKSSSKRASQLNGSSKTNDDSSSDEDDDDDYARNERFNNLQVNYKDSAKFRLQIS